MKLAALALLPVAALGFAAATPAGAPKLAFPMACEPGRTCWVQHYIDRDPGPGTRDYHCGLNTYEGHTATDIRVADMAAVRRGVNVMAAAPGRVLYTRDGVPDHAIGQPVDPHSPQGCGNAVSIAHGGGWTTAYCHMANGSVTVKPGDEVAAGQVLGRVGLSGLSEFPHLHFDVRHDGKIVDPFAPDMTAACGTRQAGLWAPGAAAKMPYAAGSILTVAFVGAPVTATDAESAANIRPFDADAAYVAMYGRALGLLPGDEIELELRWPDGSTVARARRPPLKAWRSQSFDLIGDKRPAAGFPKGTYVADYRIWRAGKVVLSRRVTTRL